MQLIKEQIEQFEQFVSKLPISKVRSDIERLWDEVKNSGYNMRTEQLDKLKSFSIHIEDVTLQSFVQSFEHWVKSEEGHESPKEAPKEKIPDADLGKGVASSIKKSKVVDKDISDSSVSPSPSIPPSNDKINKSVPNKKLEEKKKETKELEKEAKKGDLHRSVAGMKDSKSNSKIKVINKKKKK